MLKRGIRRQFRDFLGEEKFENSREENLRVNWVCREVVNEYIYFLWFILLTPLDYFWITEVDSATAKWSTWEEKCYQILALRQSGSVELRWGRKKIAKWTLGKYRKKNLWWPNRFCIAYSTEQVCICMSGGSGSFGGNKYAGNQFLPCFLSHPRNSSEFPG